jgi:hypothetical protein
MSAFKIVGLLIGLLLSFCSIIIAVFMVSWGWTDSGRHWSTGWTFASILWSLPFWFSFWIVYRYCDSNLKPAILAELGVVLAIVLLILSLLAA